MSKLEAAIQWAEMGCYVFPCAPGTKIPHAGTNGLLDATNDIEEVKRLWAKYGEDSNVAIDAGASGLVVVDVDIAEHEILDRLDETWIQRTPHGCWHFIYRQPEIGPKIRNVKKGVIATDVETRGEGGYFLVPPSTVRRRDGKTGTYDAVNQIPPQACPQWIADVVAAHEAAKNKPMTLRPSMIVVQESWGRGRLRAICDRLARAGDGSRNNELISASGAAGRIVGAGHIGYDEARDAIWSVASAWPSHSKSKATIKRGLQWGMSSPIYPEDNGWTSWSDLDTSGIDWDELNGAPVRDTVIDVKAHEAEQTHDQGLWSLLSKVRALGGLCDSWAAWCLRGAVYPQPGLTVGGLVALGGALGSRRWTYRGVTSTTYVVLLAETATGKSRPQECVEECLRAPTTKLLGPGNIVSAKALWRTVREAADSGYGVAYVLDEYGDQLNSMLSKRSGAGADMHAWLLKLATINARTVTWGQSATDGGDLEIAQAPGLQILGGTTPTQLHEAIGASASASGFVGRHLWLPSLREIPRKRREAHRERSIPSDVAAEVREIWAGHTTWHASPAGSSVDPEIGIPCEETEEAAKALDAWDDSIEAQRHGSAGALTVPAEVLGRATEAAQRVALSLAVLGARGGVPVVSVEVVEAATAVVSVSLAAIGRTLSEDAARNDYERARRDVGRAIAAGATTLRELARAVRYLSHREIMEQLQRGEAEGRWHVGAGERKNQIVITVL